MRLLVQRTKGNCAWISLYSPLFAANEILWYTRLDRDDLHGKSTGNM